MSKPDFIRSFLEWTGDTECPEEYLRWAALSLLAVSCSDRIYTLRRFGNLDLKVVPNLYCILVGPSANYKSFAMERICDILDVVNYKTTFSLFNGHVTAAGMIDTMNSEHWATDEDGKRRKEERPWNKHMYLLNDELAACVGASDFADMFVRYLTKMYFGRLFDDVTRTNGRIKLENFTVNWFASSTADWLIRSLNPDTMDAGFFRRTILVNCGYSGKRIWEPRQNPRTDTLFEYLANRVDELLVTNGCIGWTPDAQRVAKEWYLSQEEPQDNRLASSARDGISLIIKLALLLTISRHQELIDDEAISDGITLMQQTLRWKNAIMPQMLRGNKGRTEQELLTMIRERETIPRHVLTKVAYDKFHMKVNELQSLIATWIGANMIEERKVAPNKGGTIYVACRR